ncbi:hypothetical protein BN977_02255 [Mycolicibacterium cosmeticum]|uniref:Uncharacterized protein n=1 Tax=Mycolicibacterium cosmeticum TaxID=258533 RepID=W9APN3_MYCCO|nr:hypothetical protein BN977_02255 [Mycolicibacterium cosmeticum]
MGNDNPATTTENRVGLLRQTSCHVGQLWLSSVYLMNHVSRREAFDRATGADAAIVVDTAAISSL